MARAPCPPPASAAPRRPSPPSASATPTSRCPASPTSAPEADPRTPHLVAAQPKEVETMLRSLFSSISGMRANQTMMDVVGNNISNVNTVGYKTASTEFEDTLSQMLQGASAPQDR